MSWSDWTSSMGWAEGAGSTYGDSCFEDVDAVLDLSLLPNACVKPPTMRLQAATGLTVPPCGVLPGSASVSYVFANLMVASLADEAASSWNSALALTSSNFLRKACSASSRRRLAWARFSRRLATVLSTSVCCALGVFAAFLCRFGPLTSASARPTSSLGSSELSSLPRSFSSLVRTSSSLISCSVFVAADFIIACVNGGTTSRG
mmetsp:Transcript_595/g.1949  ORF Transcript_595/g.1949 Transcript_595/m.1949 type:complete len:205 (+) Transcript_595:409-1023(+)